MHNAGGFFNEMIGKLLTFGLGRHDEAEIYLSEAVLYSVSILANVVFAYTNIYFVRLQYDKAQFILRWCIDMLSGLAFDDKPGYTDKINSALNVNIAFAQMKSGEKEEARRTLEHSVMLAKRFDLAPDYKAESLRFIRNVELQGIYDSLGNTAVSGLHERVSEKNDEEFTALWNEVYEDE